MALLACRLWLREGGREGGPFSSSSTSYFSPQGTWQCGGRRREKGRIHQVSKLVSSLLSHRFAMRLAKATPMPLCLHPSPFLPNGVCPDEQLRGPSQSEVTYAFPT